MTSRAILIHEYLWIGGYPPSPVYCLYSKKPFLMKEKALCKESPKHYLFNKFSHHVNEALLPGRWRCRKNVLYIGPDHFNHRGGIGAVLEVYSNNLLPFKFIPTYSNRSFLHRFYFYFRSIVMLIYTLTTDKSVEIVHLHSSSRGSFIRKSLLLMISRLFRKKTILHIHASDFHVFYARAGMLRRCIRFIMTKPDVVICLSQKWKDYFIAHFKIRETVIINNVIEQVRPKKKTIAMNGRVNFLFLGCIGARKGIFDLLEALHQNEEAFKGKYNLVVAGNGEVDKLQKIIADSHPDGSVSYAGWVNGAKKTALLQQCDVYVLPSYNEGLPVSVLEALAYGKAIISTNVGGIPEVVRTGYNGWLFQAGDLSALMNIMQEAISNMGRLREYGANSLQISKAYTPGPVFQSLDALYKKLNKD
ncbi:MAG: glycosyltransferase family 4 protein [Flavitalea sp.]